MLIKIEQKKIEDSLDKVILVKKDTISDNFEFIEKEMKSFILTLFRGNIIQNRSDDND